SKFRAPSAAPAAVREVFAGRGILPTEKASDAAPPTATASSAGSPSDYAETPLIDESGEAPETEERETSESVTQRLAKMTFADRLKAAVKGSREMRSILVRDPNKMIAAAVLSSPKLTESEVEGIARMATVSEDVLR